MQHSTIDQFCYLITGTRGRMFMYNWKKNFIILIFFYNSHKNIIKKAKFPKTFKSE